MMRTKIAAAAAAVALGAAGCAADTAQVPKCKPAAQGCRQTSSNVWVPLAWWTVLRQQQHNTATPRYEGVPAGDAPSSSGVPRSSLAEPAPVEESHPVEVPVEVHPVVVEAK